MVSSSFLDKEDKEMDFILIKLIPSHHIVVGEAQAKEFLK